MPKLSTSPPSPSLIIYSATFNQPGIWDSKSKLIKSARPSQSIQYSQPTLSQLMATSYKGPIIRLEEQAIELMVIKIHSSASTIQSSEI